MEKSEQAAHFCILRPALPLADKLSIVGQEMVQGTDILGVEMSSPLPTLLDHPGHRQLEGLPWAGLLLAAST